MKKLFVSLLLVCSFAWASYINIGATGGGGGSGDVVGPASSTDGFMAAFDGATGKLLKQGILRGTASALLFDADNTYTIGTTSGNRPYQLNLTDGGTDEFTINQHNAIYRAQLGIEDAGVTGFTRFYIDTDANTGTTGQTTNGAGRIEFRRNGETYFEINKYADVNESAWAHFFNGDYTMLYAASGATKIAKVEFGKANGTLASPTSWQAGDSLGRIWWYGYDAESILNSKQEAARIDVVAQGTKVTDKLPASDMVFTTADDSDTLIERLRLTYDGKANFSNSDVVVATVGKGIQIKEGTNAKMGTTTLSSGTVTVSNTSVTSNSRIFLTCQDPNGGTPGALYVSARTASTSFTITSTSGSDSCIVAYELKEPAP